MKIIDMRSDTTTHPTQEMRQAMYDAEVGDDGYREDPTVNRLQQIAADMLNKEAALYTSSGTMSNLISVLSSTRPGDEIILGSEAHMLWYELGGASTIGGVVMRAITSDENGRMDVADVEQALKQNNTHNRQITLLCLENTHTRCGGAVLTPDYTSAVAGLAHEHGLKVHLDGARIFNAAAALDVHVSELTKSVDSVSICLSKGLGAPVGSLLCGSLEFIEKARRWRKMLGGGMRQAGVIAAAGIVALEKMVDRLKDDQKNARRLAIGLSEIDGITVPLYKVQSNIITFEISEDIQIDIFKEQLNNKGIKFGYAGGNRFRVVTHWMVSETDIEDILDHVSFIMKGLS